MDQTIISAFDNLTEDSIKNALVKEFDNASHSRYLHVKQNKVQKNGDVTFSVWAQTSLAIRISIKKGQYIVEIPTKQIPVFTSLSDTIGQSDITSTAQPKWSQFTVPSVDGVYNLSKPLSAVYISVLSEMGGGSFACCSRYVECSDAKKCTNPSFMMALSCAYKKNLEAGRIFYGKNKNN